MADDHPTDEAFVEGPVDDSLEPSEASIPIDSAAEEPTSEQRLAEAEDRVLRLQAELQNVLNRKSREVAEQRKYGAIDLMRGMLPAIDNIDRAIESAEKSSDESSLLEGFRLVRQQLVTVLEQQGCVPIETDGADFDPDLHEAILQQPSPDVEAGKIMMTALSGFRLHERVVRPAQVIVSSGSPEA